MPDRISKAIIHLDHYKHNIGYLKSIVGQDVSIMAVVKANAYGHGLEEIAKAAVDAGATSLGIVSLGELRRIRAAGLECPALILNYLDHESIDEAISLDASLTAMDTEFIDAVNAVAMEQLKTVKMHLKVDTGMHRAGCDPESVLSLAKQIATSSHLELEGIFTHLAESEDESSSFTDAQLDVFDACINELKEHDINPPVIHAANGAAIVAHERSRYTMVRPGLISYGVNPLSESHPEYNVVELNIKPVMEITSKVVLVRDIEIGESVGYNRRWKAERPSRIALIPIGYGDGFRRSPSSAIEVLIRGQRLPIIGSISMDQTTIDITDHTDIVQGDEVVLLGTQDQASITAADRAEQYQTIAYEVLTSIADRMDRQYVSSK